jgi:hypothetical protein
MTVSRHLEEAVARLREAEVQITQVSDLPRSLENLHVWLQGLTAYCKAMADIHTYNNESIHEKLHELAAATGLKSFRSSA